MARKIVGVRRHGRGWQIYGKVRGIPFCEQFPLSASLTAMLERRRQIQDDLKKQHPTPTPGTLTDDIVTRYLPTLADRPALQRDRAYHLAWWVDRFGHRRRQSLRRDELLAALAELAVTAMPKTGQPPAASTRKKYRTALYHLFTTLDGKNAPNPLRDIAPPKEPDPEPRWIPYPIIDALFAAIDDHRYRGVLTTADVMAIRTRAAEPDANASAIARDYGISETRVRKIRAGRYSGRSDLHKTKARLKVMAFVGLAPAHIAQIRPATDINWDEPSLLVRSRQKGEGSRTVRVPLTPEGVQALKDLIAAKAIGKFSAWKIFRDAVARMVGELARTDWRLARAVHHQLARATPYALRHSYLTEAQLAGGNIHATQALATHSDIRQTRRYTLASVDPQLRVLSEKLTERLAKRRGLGG